jgi:hypothetical protein
MLSVTWVAIATLVVIALIAMMNGGGPSRLSKAAWVFAALSPMPLILTVAIPAAINMATSFNGGRAVYGFTVVGCLLSFVLLFTGVVLYFRSSLNGRRETLLIPATLLSAVPAMIIIFIYLFGFGGVLRR